MSTFNDTVQVVANATIIESALPEAMTIWMIIEVVVVTAVLAMSELYLAIVKSVFLAGVSALEMVFLGIVLLALHYWILPSHFDFIHKPNRIMPGIKRQPLHPRDILFDCKLIMLAVDLANVGLNLTEFGLMLPILMAFLGMHLLVGVILWCSLPAPLRPVRLVLRLCQLAPNRASATGSKALLEKSLVIVPRGSRSIQFWVRNQVVKLAETKLRQVLGSIPASILDFLAATDWDEQFERLMAVTARVAHYLFFETLPVVFCHDFLYVVSISQE